MLTPWYQTWFNQHYSMLYGHRDENQAQHQVSFLMNYLSLPKSACLLDLGCGEGRHLKAFKQLGYTNFWGLDLSHWLLSQNPFPNRIVQGDMKLIPFLYSQFNLIASFFSSFGYFESKREDIEMLQGVCHCLIPKGYFFLDLANKNVVLNDLVEYNQKTIQGHQVKQSRSYLKSTIIKQIELTSPTGKIYHYQEKLRLYDLFQIQEILHTIGFKIITVFGNEKGESYNPPNLTSFISISPKDPKIMYFPRASYKWENALNKDFNSMFLNNLNNIKNRKNHVLNQNWDRVKIHQWAKNETQDLTLSSLQKKYLSDLKKPDTLILVTGQQPSLLGGPLYCFYKAMTTINWAKQYSKQLGVAVIPLFWIAGDDSDFRECGAFECFEKNQVDSFFDPTLFKLSNIKGKPMSLNKLDKGFLKVEHRIKNWWNKDTLDLFHKLSSPNDTLTSHFKKVLHHFFKPQGLLFVDGFSSTFQELSVVAMQKIITQANDFESLLNKTSQQWQSPQVIFPSNTVHAFELKKNRRERVTNNTYTQSTKYTHDVVSRPILIEQALPVLSHVLGPSEIGYFLQLEGIFKQWYGSMPILIPRAMVNTIPNRLLKMLQQLCIPSSQLKNLTRTEITKKYILKHLKPFDFTTQWKQDILKAVKETAVTHSFIHKIKVAENHFNQKYHRYLLKQDLYYQKLMQESVWIHPEQQRHLNIFSLVNQLGEKGVQTILQQTTSLSTDHQIIGFD